MENSSSLKSKSHKVLNEMEANNFHCHIKPKPRTKRKSKQHASAVDLQQSHGPFTAMTESPLCYPVHSVATLPPTLPLEHHASVSFLPIYQPPCCPSYQCCHPKPPPTCLTPTHSNKKHVVPKENGKYINSINNTNDSFTSLPPVIPLNAEDSPSLRRFSDPGLGNDDLSITSDDTRDVDDHEESPDMTSLDFEEEMIMMKKDYCKMNRELSKTRKELALLKSVVQNQNVHSPPLLTDIIKEIQRATDEREDAFLSRVQCLVDQSNLAQLNSKECSCKTVLLRLESLENQVRQLQLTPSPIQSPANNVLTEISSNSVDLISNDRKFNSIDSNSGGKMNYDKREMNNYTGLSTNNINKGLNPFTEQTESFVKPSTEL